MDITRNFLEKGIDITQKVVEITGYVTQKALLATSLGLTDSHYVAWRLRRRRCQKDKETAYRPICIVVDSLAGPL